MDSPDERLNVSLTPDQADSLWRLLKAAQAVFPYNPPRYSSLASSSQMEDAIRLWHTTFKLSSVNLENLGIRLAEATNSGVMDALERKNCPHPIIVDSGIAKRCRRCMAEIL